MVTIIEPCMNNQVRELLFDVADVTVWGIIGRHLPELMAQIETLLQEPDPG